MLQLQCHALLKLKDPIIHLTYCIVYVHLCTVLKAYVKAYNTL